MDGTELMLGGLRDELCGPGDAARVVGVSYPRNRHLGFDELADFVTKEYLDALREDPRGYVLVSQSYSGHVLLRLAGRDLPGQSHGQVFVNAFVSPPAPTWLRSFAPPAALFRNQPPARMVSNIFLGRGGVGMDIVQAAGAKVDPHVMAARLADCLREDSWHLWRSPHVLVGNRSLYLTGADDCIVSRAQSSQMARARSDVEFVTIDNGPHLLLQRYGWASARVIGDFCQRVQQIDS